MSAVPQLGKETEFSALGKVWKVGRFTLKAWDELLALARPHLPDPYDGLKELLPSLDKELARELVLEAQKAKRRILSINSPEVQEWIETPEGLLSLFYVLLKQAHPEMTPELAVQIAAEVSEAQQAAMIAAASGTPPPEKNVPARVA
jgi:hypothetical protein